MIGLSRLLPICTSIFRYEQSPSIFFNCFRQSFVSHMFPCVVRGDLRFYIEAVQMIMIAAHFAERIDAFMFSVGMRFKKMASYNNRV